MTADSTVPPPAGQPRAAGHASSVAVLHPRTPHGGFRPPPGRLVEPRTRHLPLLAVDGAAALLSTLALSAPQRHPVLVALLIAGVGGWNARSAPRRTVAPPALLDELPALCGRILVAWALLAALVAAVAPGHALSPGTLLVAWSLQTLSSCAGRAVVHSRRRAALVRQPRAALVIGPADTAQRVAAAFLRQPNCGVRPVGIVSAPSAQPAQSGKRSDAGPGLPVLSSDEEVQRALIQNGVRAALVVGADAGRRHAPLLRTLGDQGCALWRIEPDSPAYDTLDGPSHGGRIAGFAYRPLAFVRAGRRRVGKRVLDVTVSGALLLVSAPVLLLCAVVLRVSDGPGVVFRQERIGKAGRPFTLLKFRTHRPADPHEAATRWSVADEQRMRPFCRFLRRTSLDELLQLWNVFRGDMSLVGPRPERPYFVAKFSQTYTGYAARHRMETGITGLAQIHGLRGDTSIEDRARFDNAYIDNWSLWQDICILLRTAAALVRPTGS
ncbi:sugar transferase [Streptomyces sp. NPDC091292]|uniref:sugar transferase n=1 Tax=Streptomyces sp. NPDC091292 TaxID=3365991 RepID=UPI00382E696A